MKRICVFSGSSIGALDEYARTATSLGRELARRGIGVVYGAASIGLMGCVADAALEEGGEVIGIIPEALVMDEVVHRGLTELKVVASMHERKALMAQLSDGFVSLPGGYGTLEELAEMITWLQLRIHAKPCGILNVQDYYGHLIRFLDHAVEQGFLKQKHRDKLLIADTVDDMLGALTSVLSPANV